MWPFSSPAPAENTRTTREACWEGRDAYFGCLDKNNVLKPGDEKGACKADRAVYEKNCAKSWVEYFDKRRVLVFQQNLANERAAVPQKPR
ncbi:hypothetical protein BT69DRAFT_1241778 [Atractiella rhizophila]|nr:hypothetical protein BT69DRAFT_1241778 [Atractiella rhizophila]